MQVNRYMKAIVACLVAAGGAAVTAMADDVITTSEWVTIALAGLAALGVVWAVPNKTEVSAGQRG